MRYLKHKLLVGKLHKYMYFIICNKKSFQFQNFQLIAPSTTAERNYKTNKINSKRTSINFNVIFHVKQTIMGFFSRFLLPYFFFLFGLAFQSHRKKSHLTLFIIIIIIFTISFHRYTYLFTTFLSAFWLPRQCHKENVKVK